MLGIGLRHHPLLLTAFEGLGDRNPGPAFPGKWGRRQLASSRIVLLAHGPPGDMSVTPVKTGTGLVRSSRSGCGIADKFLKAGPAGPTL